MTAARPRQEAVVAALGPRSRLCETEINLSMSKMYRKFDFFHTLGARAPIISGHMLNTLRIQSISDHNVSSGQKSDTFKMYPVM